MRHTITPARSHLFSWIGIAVPVVLVTLAVWNSVPSFDGAMNLQVAQSIAEGDGFQRYYSEGTLFPDEIQTSGYFMLFQALVIRLLGPDTAVFQFANLAFIALLAIGTSLAVRRWPVARLIAPSLVIFALPGGSGSRTLTLGVGGYGEFAVAALAIVACVAMARAFEADVRRPHLMIALASIAAGVAITIKIVAVLIVPVLAVGLVLGLIARRPRAPGRAILTAASGIVPIVIFEAYRLISLGSWRAYADHWGNEAYATAMQAGVTGENVYASDPAAHQGRTVFGKIAEHWLELSHATGIDWFTLIVIVLAPFAILTLVAYRHRATWREWCVGGQGLLATQLALYAGGYLVWWLAITPTEKAWYRRIVIAVVCVIVLYVVVTCLAMEEMKASSRPIRRLRTPALMIGAATACAVAVAGSAVASSLTGSVVEAVRSMPWSATASNHIREQAVREAAATVDRLSSEGDTVYGMGWWSAPVVQLYAQGKIDNLLAKDDITCLPDLVEGRGHLVWDSYALRLADLYATAPDSIAFAAEPPFAADYARFYRILVPSDGCPAPVG
ncbi:MAG: hypothetical protein LBK72_02820 [Bifidobacteriaceae bacterium]|jgi:hypothetical protein|nr:hypothetical protein [Bifidobacteriaceae bacterium]